MHKRNDTAFANVATQRTQNTGDTASVASENSVRVIQNEYTVPTDCRVTLLQHQSE